MPRFKDNTSPDQHAISAVQALRPGSYRAQAVGGGCIHPCYRVAGDNTGQTWFVKVAGHADGSRSDAAAMLQAEADGVQALAATGCVRTPQVMGLSQPVTGVHCLVLEYLELHRGAAGAALGQALASLHHCYGEAFGWPHDNYLGLTPQPNTPCADGVADGVKFLARRRLGYQLELARQDGLDAGLIDAGWHVVDNLPLFYRTYRPRPSLLHGDLWQGNQAQLADGTPVIFDPAVHYGDAEADLAMTELFGGFGADFYAAYREHAGIDEGYRVRRDLHQLYHVLNHCHLFGASYAGQARHLLQRLQAEF